MIKRIVLAALATTVLGAVWVGCATSGVGSTSSGAGGKSTTTKTTSSAGSTGSSGSTTGTGGGGTGSGTGGGGGYSILCNPVTNAGCKSNSVCDYSTDSAGNVLGFRCYIAQTPAALCGSCDTVSCGGGLTCFYVDQSQTTTACARYCCNDGDCGSGVCQFTDGTTNLLFGPATPNLGVCVAGATAADAGAGAVFSCDAPVASPSNGSCVTLSP